AAGLARFPASASLFLDEGRAPRIPEQGELVRPMHKAAALLTRLAAAGPEDFYTGETGAALVRDLTAGGCVITRDDIASYEPRWLPPLRTTYRGRQLFAVPRLSGGPSLFQSLNELESSLASAGDGAA